MIVRYAASGLEATVPALARFDAVVFIRSAFDEASGLSTVDVEQIVTAGAEPTKRYDPGNPLADKDGNVWESAVDETRELVDMLESSRTYQNNVEVMQTAKQLIVDTLKLGR